VISKRFTPRASSGPSAASYSLQRQHACNPPSISSTPGTLANGSPDDSSRRCWILVFPNPQDQPSGLPEPSIRVGVAPSVGLDLLPPELRIRFGPSAVLRAPVPEAAVHEHRYTRGLE